MSALVVETVIWLLLVAVLLVMVVVVLGLAWTALSTAHAIRGACRRLMAPSRDDQPPISPRHRVWQGGGRR